MKLEGLSDWDPGGQAKTTLYMSDVNSSDQHQHPEDRTPREQGCISDTYIVRKAQLALLIALPPENHC